MVDILEVICDDSAIRKWVLWATKQRVNLETVVIFLINSL